jgi:hypothetical protein
MKSDIINFLKSDKGNENKKKGVCKILEKFGDVDFENPDKVFEEFEKLDISPATKRTYFGVVSYAIGKLTGSVYEEGQNKPKAMSDLHKKYNDIYTEKTKEIILLNPKKKINIIDPPIINDNDSNEVKYNKFLLKLFLQYPPLRKQDYFQIDLKNSGDDRNYYKDGIFVFNKLEKVNRKSFITLSSEDKILFDSIRGDRAFLINHTFNLERISKEFCGNSFNWQNLRTMYLTRKNEEFATNGRSFHSNVKEMIEICSKMNTTIQLFIDFYCRNE